ncbi:MAG: hypothetical protein M3077_05950 [Candidatus Dormibacteraeota bacterium]|nr:hypothetical protein [Candidatus Dormibacteraeota bacterium]
MSKGLTATSVRAASQADSLVNDMRGALVQAVDPTAPAEDGDQVERAVTYRVTTILMVVLLSLLFITSAVPDIGPSLASVVQAQHL